MAQGRARRALRGRARHRAALAGRLWRAMRAVARNVGEKEQ